MPAVDHAGQRREDHHQHAAGQMRGAEHRGGDDQRQPCPQPLAEALLQVAAKQRFFGHADEEQVRHHERQDPCGRMQFDFKPPSATASSNSAGTLMINAIQEPEATLFPLYRF